MLPLFIQASKYKNDKDNQIPNVGNVVLIDEESTSKMNFKLGIIDSLKPSRDGAKRMANIPYVINDKTVHV